LAGAGQGGRALIRASPHCASRAEFPRCAVGELDFGGRVDGLARGRACAPLRSRRCHGRCAPSPGRSRGSPGAVRPPPSPPSAARYPRSPRRPRNLAPFLRPFVSCGPEGRMFESCWARQFPVALRAVAAQSVLSSSRAFGRCGRGASRREWTCGVAPRAAHRTVVSSSHLGAAGGFDMRCGRRGSSAARRQPVDHRPGGARRPVRRSTSSWK